MSKTVYTISSAAAIGSVLLMAGVSNASAMSAKQVTTQNSNWVHMGSITQVWSSNSSDSSGSNGHSTTSFGATGPRSYSSFSSTDNQSTSVSNTTTVNSSTSTSQSAGGGESQNTGNTAASAVDDWTVPINSSTPVVDGSALAAKIQNDVRMMLNSAGVSTTSTAQAGGTASNSSLSVTNVSVGN